MGLVGWDTRYAREASLAALHDPLYFAEGSTFCPSSFKFFAGTVPLAPSLAEGA